MSEPEPFAVSWNKLGASVEIAHKIVSMDPAAVVGITAARQASGTEVERSALEGLAALREAVDIFNRATGGKTITDDTETRLVVTSRANSRLLIK
jgi:hypothetical protein